MRVSFSPTLGALSLVGTLIAGALACAPGARADAVGAPPTSCPRGSTPGTSHAGPHCDPAPTCVMSATCSGGATCEPAGVCVEMVRCGGRIPPDSGPCFESHVVGTCSMTSACSRGTCELANRCVAPGSSGGGCACAVRGRDRMTPVIALGVLAIVAARRRGSRAVHG